MFSWKRCISLCCHPLNFVLAAPLYRSQVVFQSPLKEILKTLYLHPHCQSYSNLEVSQYINKMLNLLTLAGQDKLIK